jgi:hypothetical protein
MAGSLNKSKIKKRKHKAHKSITKATKITVEVPLGAKTCDLLASAQWLDQALSHLNLNICLTH